MSGFEDFSRAVEQHKDKTIFAYFTGSKDAEGKSWCPDCVEGEAGIRGLLPRGSGRRTRLWPESGIEKRQREPDSGRPAGLSELSSGHLFTLFPSSVKSSPTPRVLSTIRPI